MAEPSRRGRAVSEHLAQARWPRRPVPKRTKPCGPTSSPNCTNSGSKRSNKKRNRPSCVPAGLPGKGRKKRALNRLADCAGERTCDPWAGPIDLPADHATTLAASVGKRQRTRRRTAVLGEGDCSERSRDSAPRATSRTCTRIRTRTRTDISQGVASGTSGRWPLAGLVYCPGDPTGDPGQAVAPFDTQGDGGGIQPSLWWHVHHPDGLDDGSGLVDAVGAVCSAAVPGAGRRLGLSHRPHGPDRRGEVLRGRRHPPEPIAVSGDACNWKT